MLCYPLICKPMPTKCGPIPDTRRKIVEILEALDSFAADHAGKFPRSLVELVLPDGRGHYHLTPMEVPRDSWGNELAYEPPDPENGGSSPHVWSLGEDGISGTVDDIDSRTIDDD